MYYNRYCNTLVVLMRITSCQERRAVNNNIANFDKAIS